MNHHIFSNPEFDHLYFLITVNQIIDISKYDDIDIHLENIFQYW